MKKGTRFFKNYCRLSFSHFCMYFLLIRKRNRNLDYSWRVCVVQVYNVHCIVYYVIAEQQQRSKEVAEQSCRMCTLCCYCSLTTTLLAVLWLSLLTRKQKAHFFSFSIECSFSPLSPILPVASLFLFQVHFLGQSLTLLQGDLTILERSKTHFFYRNK